MVMVAAHAPIQEPQQDQHAGDEHEIADHLNQQLGEEGRQLVHIPIDPFD
jgi:hypothetical protein